MMESGLKVPPRPATILNWLPANSTLAPVSSGLFADLLARGRGKGHASARIQYVDGGSLRGGIRHSHCIRLSAAVLEKLLDGVTGFTGGVQAAHEALKI